MLPLNLTNHAVVGDGIAKRSAAWSLCTNRGHGVCCVSEGTKVDAAKRHCDKNMVGKLAWVLASEWNPELVAAPNLAEPFFRVMRAHRGEFML